MAYFPGGTATLVSNGTAGGTFDVDDASFLVPGAIAYLGATGVTSIEVQIKRVSGTTVMVRATSLTPQFAGSDVTAFTTAGGATLTQPPQNVWDWRAVAGGLNGT